MVRVVRNKDWAMARLVIPPAAIWAPLLRRERLDAAQSLAARSRARGEQLLASSVGEAGGAAAVGEVERGPQRLARVGATADAADGGSQLEERPGVLKASL
jgi:hypothetical protein